MTMFDGSTSDPAPKPPARAPRAGRTQELLLIWASSIGWAFTIVFAVWGASIDTGPSMFGGIDTDALALKSGLGAWADIAMLVAITSTVGLIVLRGVTAIFESRWPSR